MRIFLHDFGGHPFPMQLSRKLASRGHDVQHAYCGSLRTTPQGELEIRDDDPATLSSAGIRLGEPLSKYKFVKRWRQENEYGRRLVARALDYRPDVVLSGQTPLDAQKRLLRACREKGIPFVFWVQDLLGVGSRRILRKKLYVLGDLIGARYERLEFGLLRQSDAAIVLTDDFVPILEREGIPPDRINVIQNWAPIDALPTRPKSNDWAKANGLSDAFVFLYSGTLGIKHNPQRLAELAARFEGHGNVRVVVISTGIGADYLHKEKAVKNLEALTVRDFVPFEQLPDVLATADVLVGLLEPDAGVYSVPSKVLTYMCAQRAILLSVPPQNLAAREVSRERAGLCVDPESEEGFLRAAVQLKQDAEMRSRLARHARAYAEKNFNIDRIADRFESVLRSAMTGHTLTRSVGDGPGGPPP